MHEANVLSEEKEIVNTRRASCLRNSDSDGFAVCFSGGGVRSAAFCTGVLWALAETGRLKDVTHLSSVSGGSVAACSFISFLYHHAQRNTAPADGNIAADQWYRGVVADMVETCQTNAGYLLSFHQDANGSWKKKVCDFVIRPLVMVGILFVVLVLAPAKFTFYYIVPLTLLLEATWGGDMRRISCQQGVHYKIGNSWSITGKEIHLVLFCLGIASVVLLVLTRMQNNKNRMYLHLRSCMGVCHRWFLLVFMVVAALELVMYAQWVDYTQGTGDTRIFKNCSDYRPSDHGQSTGNQVRCTDLHVTGAIWSVENPAASTNKTLIIRKKINPYPLQPEMFWKLLGYTIVAAVVALVFLAVGISFAWQALVAVLIPVWFLWPACFLLQWRAFGPLSGQGLFAPLLGFELTGNYSDSSWNQFVNVSLSLGILFLPFLGTLDRTLHAYFAISLRKAFLKDGKDVRLNDVARCPCAPILLFGATSCEFQRPQDEDPDTPFVLTQRVMGCERTKWVTVPPRMSLSNCMSLSSAAIDAFFLTMVKHWTTRLVFTLLNLSQGAWVRFDIGQSWHQLHYSFQRKHPWTFDIIERLPEMCVFTVIHCGLMATNAFSVVPPEGANQACHTFKVFRSITLSVILLLVGILSFFPHIFRLSWLTVSPLIRQIHMFLLNPTTAEHPPMHLYLADGGITDDLGLVVLLRRRCRWILSVDCGDDPDCKLVDLRNAIEAARKDKLCSFFDLVDPRKDLDSLLATYAANQEHFLRIGVLYQTIDGSEEVADIFHTRMRFLGDSPIHAPVIRSEVAPEPERDVDSEEPICRSLAGRLGPRDVLWVPNDAPVQLNLDDTRRDQLAGCCCTCCHTSPTISKSCGCLCGRFPNLNTANQFFTPLMWANFCRLGRELVLPAIAELSRVQSEISL